MERCVSSLVVPLSIRCSRWTRRKLTRVWLNRSKQFGKPLAAFQLVQKKLADAHMEAASE